MCVLFKNSSFSVVVWVEYRSLFCLFRRYAFEKVMDEKISLQKQLQIV